MQLILAPLLPLALSLGRIHVHCSSDSEHPHPTLGIASSSLTSDGVTSDGLDLVTYAEAQNATSDGMPLATPELELKLLSGAAAEVGHLNVHDDDQRARLSAILEATRAMIGRRSGLPTTIDPDTDASTLQQWATQFEATFLEYASLSTSYTWDRCCMAALLGKNTLIRLLPSLSKGFFNKRVGPMLQAAAIVGDFETLLVVARYSRLSFDDLQGYIGDYALFSGNVEFVRKVVEFVPRFVQDCFVLETAIKLNHRPLFEYLYAKVMELPFELRTLYRSLPLAFEALVGRGWEDLVERLYNEHAWYLNTERCLLAAAKHDRTDTLKFLLFHDDDRANAARPYLGTTFEAAVGSGSIEAIKFLIEHDKSGAVIIPNLPLTQPSPTILKRVGESGRWEGIEYLMQLKNEGDIRFEKFKLTGDASRAMKDACVHGNLNVLQHLLKKDPQGRFIFSFQTPMMLFQRSLTQACYHGHLPIVQELLHHSFVNPTYRQNEALMVACKRGHHAVVRELLRDGRVDASAEHNGPLVIASTRGHLLVVRELLRQRDETYIYNVDPAANDDAALIAACEQGTLLVVRELLQHRRVNPGARNNTPLIAACTHGHLLVVRELLKVDDDGKYIYNVDPAANHNAPLITACTRGHLAIAEFLLQRRPNAQGGTEYVHAGIDAAAQNNLALLRAIEGKHLEIVELLLQKTDSGSYRFPGIMTTMQMRRTAAWLWCPRLLRLLAPQRSALPCSMI